MSRVITIVRTLSLRTLLFALVGAMGTMLTVTLALNATSAWRAGALATQASQSNTTADLLLSAAAHWAVERGITNGVLSAEPPLKAEVRSQIDEHRKMADAAFTEAAARLEDDKSPAVQSLLRKANGLLRDIDQLRLRVDAEVSKPPSERDAELRTAWFPAMTRLIEVSQRLRLAAEINSDSMETRLQALQRLKHAAWVMAEYAGRERGMLNGAIQAGAPLRGEQLIALGVARGNVEYAWEIVQAITTEPGAAPALVTATKTVRDVMFGRFQQDREAVYKAGLADEPYPLSAQDWFDQSTEAIGSILRLGEAATESTRQFASEMQARSRLNLAIGLMVLAAAVLLMGIAVWFASARIARPLQEMTIVMGRLAHGETTISVPAQDRNDEIGEMAQAVEVFRKNAIRIGELYAEKIADQRRDAEIRKLNHELTGRAAELAAANKELESFAYSVSHDLRAPLRHLLGYSELLLKHASKCLDEEGQRYVQTILESAKRMGNLIDDLLAFSRIGRTETRTTAVDLQQLVADVASEIEAQGKGQDISWKIGPLPVCYGDRALLRVALVNLLSNAVKFSGTRRPAKIEVGSVDGRGDKSEIFVRDNGVGFDMKYVDKLFGVFQRLHRADEFEGTGIGLATVQRIVHRHGGAVRAEGTVDQGATFYFSLPKAKRQFVER
ncbi:sensor histidine kinase [Bradyrhizobium uaiense]|uniref:histidine kinase n=1 Tax=Bradyrhizobium uaiense TaxID=2594946 RepID=A0A6P1BWU5_9BRAD|nr:ATP-binding protein [Bradyrhizobium uaiense]NEV02600.1 HAMP domain-containing protein [Bradyrhizobium uaiense]